MLGNFPHLPHMDHIIAAISDSSIRSAVGWPRLSRFGLYRGGEAGRGFSTRSQAPAWERLSSKLCFAACQQTLVCKQGPRNQSPPQSGSSAASCSHVVALHQRRMTPERVGLREGIRWHAGEAELRGYAVPSRSLGPRIINEVSHHCRRSLRERALVRGTNGDNGYQ